MEGTVLESVDVGVKCSYKTIAILCKTKYDGVLWIGELDTIRRGSHPSSRTQCR